MTSSPSIVAPQMLGPVLGLNLWAYFIEGWMYAHRIPAIVNSKMEMDSTMTKAQFDARMPAPARWKADAYSNLMEQPTQFYAVAITLAMLGPSSPTIDARLAWVYVGFRIAQSLAHCLGNKIVARFYMFLGSSAVLATLTVRAVIRLTELS